MTIGVLTFEFHIPGAQSLKEKRKVVRRLKDRLRSRYNVAVAELDDHADLWQRGGLAVVSVAHGRDALEKLFEGIFRESEAIVPGHLVANAPEYLEGTDGWMDE